MPGEQMGYSPHTHHITSHHITRNAGKTVQLECAQSDKEEGSRSSASLPIYMLLSYLIHRLGISRQKSAEPIKKQNANDADHIQSYMHTNSID